MRLRLLATHSVHLDQDLDEADLLHPLVTEIQVLQESVHTWCRV